MKDAGLSNSPTPARPSDATDEQLSAELKKWSGATPALQPVGELLDRHWEAAFAYARLCTDGARPAGMLTTAAFTRLFGETLRQNGPTSAWRPQLLVTVRRIAAEWDGDHRRDMLHPELRAVSGGGDRVAARLLPPAHRRLLSGAFQRLPQSARCLLWHTEVEAEPLGTPAALLGLSEEDARVELRRARERLREECLQVHRELAPEQECRHYLRLLDVTYRRGGADIDADLRGHLDGCKHCRHTADQLHQFNAGLGGALAEAVLGWGAYAYLEARAHVHDVAREAEAQAQRPAVVGESFMATTPALPSAAPRAAAVPATDARHPAAAAVEAFEASARAASAPPAGPRTASRRSTHKASRRVSRRNLTAAVLTVSGLIVLPLVLWSSLGSSDDTTQADGDRTSEAPDGDPGTASADPSWVGSGDGEQGTMRGRLHNVASGLCVGVVGEKAVEAAETELTDCTSDAAQQWSYEPDGLLRNADDPDLCLDSHLGYSVRLAPCAGAAKAEAKGVRYDFTLQGMLVPRWDQDLALTPAATDGGGSLVVKTRDDSPAQRWVIDTSKTDLQMEVVNWGGDSTLAKVPAPTPEPSRTPTPKPTPTPSATPSTPKASPTPTPTATYPYPTSGPCQYNPYYCSGNGQYGGGYGGYPGYGGYGYGSGDGRYPN
ncbi:RICIN domain-containing protein [Streptomyces sp. AC555_RSS877]|uniref:RICIN domain-containing protein n=1 Tax=Streptomyces sp. AC555_RSS877 TaxID=2823688 RepID=UPI001C26B895|nr:RICIN domain-containing protein [Streptomyces sp. AC555_RSS877]